VAQVYHWALFVSSVGTSGRLFWAAGKSTPREKLFPPPGLVFEAQDYDLLGDPRLFLLLKLGGLGDRSPDELHTILGKVFIPLPDDEYGGSFDGRTWVIKAIMRLSAYGIIKSRRLERMEDEIQDIAARAFNVHEQGRGWTLSQFDCW